MKEKVFVLDANVLLHDPEAIFKFPRHEIAIPVTVLEELDKLKRTPGELGRNARAAIRELAALKGMGKGDLHKGVTLQNEATVRILIEMKTDFSDSLAMTINDNKIVMAAYYLFEQGKKVVFVSKDFAARVKAEAIGLETEDYENLKFNYETLSTGIRHIELEKNLIDHFYKDGHLTIPGMQFRPNEYGILSSQEHSSAVSRFDMPTNQLVPLVKIPTMWGIKPRNVEQKCAMDALLRDDCKLVTLLGPAGTGKTLLALACGLRKVFDEGLYTKILVSRPIVPLGRDIGYLPGTKEEKLSSWMQPIFDNLELLCASLGNEPTDTLRWVLDSKKIEMEAVTYIRGRSLPKMFIIIDEAQNLTPHEIKTIISRAGDGTKVVLAGDPTQIDNPYLDKDSNGLTYTVGKFNNSNLHSHVYLEKTERSELAAQATEFM
ncbi:MAG: PhoH family protein [Verrucomicrobia bacterium]|nr:PhoH family protein [Verrucomicrobiota bacterium]MBS0635897.1 PhoH family protein [Verrucomicrobiota bacterium]